MRFAFSGSFGSFPSDTTAKKRSFSPSIRPLNNDIAQHSRALQFISLMLAFAHEILIRWQSEAAAYGLVMP
ncbi:MAG: hypothetical protein AB7U75_03605 [Hyphomicrobiaceae bacterium]